MALPVTKPMRRTRQLRHNPLHVDIEADMQVSPHKSVNPRRKSVKFTFSKNAKEGNEDILKLLHPALSKKILGEAKKQTSGEFDSDDDDAAIAHEEEIDDVVAPLKDADEFVFGDDGNEQEEEEVTPFLENSIGRSAGTLADALLEKLRQKQTAKSSDRRTSMSNEADEKQNGELPDEVVNTYTAVAHYLSRYRSGKLPKPFKIIPRVTNWEEILSLTEPENWTPHAMREATKLFASNFNPKMAQRFYNLVLLPAIREDILKTKKLNVQYFEALKKAMFKPDAWFKGMLLPLAQDNCTYKEALIFGTIMKQVSIPMLHAAAALARLSQLTPWYGTTSILMCVLIDKKYALPMQVIDILVDHFCSFANDTRSLPVVWHRCLLTFSQRYKHAFTNSHRAKLREILKLHRHHLISQEVHREVFDPTTSLIQLNEMVDDRKRHSDTAMVY